MLASLRNSGVLKFFTFFNFFSFFISFFLNLQGLYSKIKLLSTTLGKYAKPLILFLHSTIPLQLEQFLNSKLDSSSNDVYFSKYSLSNFNLVTILLKYSF